MMVAEALLLHLRLAAPALQLMVVLATLQLFHMTLRLIILVDYLKNNGERSKGDARRSHNPGIQMATTQTPRSQREPQLAKSITKGTTSTA